MPDTPRRGPTMAGDPTETTINGFIILGPGPTPYLAYQTFGRTMAEAWTRHIGSAARETGEVETLRNRWAQKGWRPVPAQIVIGG